MINPINSLIKYFAGRKIARLEKRIAGLRNDVDCICEDYLMNRYPNQEERERARVEQKDNLERARKVVYERYLGELNEGVRVLRESLSGLN